MKPDQSPLTPEDYNQPVAYDAQGRPLYAHPPVATAPAATPVAPQIVHVSRSVEPVKYDISPEVKAKHDASVRQYPFLNLSDAEYIISAVRRHPIGLIMPVTLTAVLLGLIFFVLFSYENLAATSATLAFPTLQEVFFPLIALALAVAFGGFAVIYVYLANKFFLTNESVIQEVQLSLFSRHEQTVSLGNIEDASFRQEGMLQSILDYGSIRLSTEGDETTYRFKYVANPKKQIALLNNAVEAFKNGRPIDTDES
jgi:hypothetical protein